MCCIRLRASCCGCCKLRTGAIIIGVLHLVLSLLAGADYVYSWVRAMRNDIDTTQQIVGVAVFGFSVLVASLLIIGAVHDSKALCLVWVVWASIHLAGAIALAAYAAVVTFFLRPTGSAASDGWLQLARFLTIALLVVSALIIIVLSYGIVVVCSLYRELKETHDGYTTRLELQEV